MTAILPEALKYARHYRACNARPCPTCEWLAARLIAATDAELDAEEVG